MTAAEQITASDHNLLARVAKNELTHVICSAAFVHNDHKIPNQQRKCSDVRELKIMESLNGSMKRNIVNLLQMEGS